MVTGWCQNDDGQHPEIQSTRCEHGLCTWCSCPDCISLFRSEMRGALSLVEPSPFGRLAIVDAPGAMSLAPEDRLSTSPLTAVHDPVRR